MSAPLWQQEHPNADVPAVIANDPRLVDISWHNDVCPSFVRAADLDAAGGVPESATRLWVDYAADEDREIPGHSRFFVADADGQNTFETDDAAAALRFLLEGK